MDNKAIRLVLESDSTGSAKLCVKKLEFGSLLKLINIFVLLFTIRLMWVTMFYITYVNINNHIEKISIKEQVARNSLSVIVASVNENIYIFEEGIF